jgi:hypothetical protein
MKKEYISDQRNQKLKDTRNEDIRQWLFAMVEIAMENDKNQKRMWEIWKAIQTKEFGEKPNRE